MTNEKLISAARAVVDGMLTPVPRMDDEASGFVFVSKEHTDALRDALPVELKPWISLIYSS